MQADDVSDEILEEGCYYLAEMGLSMEEVSAHFEISLERATNLAKSYESKLKVGMVTKGEIDRVFWEDVKKEAEGDMKLTFLSDKGFHHAWKSELGRLDGTALMSIYEASKDFLGADPNQKFLDFPPPKGYDPLAMDRELRKAVGVIGEMLAEKWKSDAGSSDKKAAKT
jgi:hypothetical protein